MPHARLKSLNDRSVADDSTEPSNTSCPICTYSLRGLAKTGRCPECGCDYDPHLLAARTTRPYGGWAYLLTVPVATIIAGFVLTDYGPIGTLAAVLLIGWCWHASKRMAAWRYEVRVQNHLRGEGPMPRPRFRRIVQHVIMTTTVLLAYVLWAFVH